MSIFWLGIASSWAMIGILVIMALFEYAVAPFGDNLVITDSINISINGQIPNGAHYFIK